MMELDHNEGRNYPLTKFENMLKTNDIYFFDADEFELIITYYMDTGKMALARKAAKIAFDQHPDSSILKLLKVEILVYENKIDTAEAILDELYEIEPYNPEIYIHKANILSKRNLHEQAVEVLKMAGELLGDDEEISSMIAMEYMFLEDFEQAKFHFLKVLDLDPQDSSSLYNIIYCFDYLDQTREAIAFLNDFLDEQPYSEIAWHQLGLQYLDLDEPMKALDCFDFAIISDDTFIGAYMEKAKLLERFEKYEEAIECYQTTIELEDATAFAYLHIGICYNKMGITGSALDYFNKSLQEDPLLDKTWLAITEFYVEREQYRQALYYIEKAIAIDEENIEYWQLYAKINQHLNRHEEAKKAFKRSQELSSFDFENRITTCDLLIEEKELEAALEEMELAQEVFSPTAEVEYRLAGLYLSLNEEKLGLLHLKKALSLDSDYASVMEDLFPEIFKSPNVQALLEKNGYYE